MMGMQQRCDPDDYRSGLQDTFEGQADWRRQKAKEYPKDERNLKAAGIFDHLAKGADAIPDDVIVAYAKLADLDEFSSEKLSEALREVGFHTYPLNAEEFVHNFITDRDYENRIKTAVPS
jgi:hypothetical protein